MHCFHIASNICASSVQHTLKDQDFVLTSQWPSSSNVLQPAHQSQLCSLHIAILQSNCRHIDFRPTKAKEFSQSMAKISLSQVHSPLKIASQVDRIKKALGTLAFISQGTEYRRCNVILQLYKTLVRVLLVTLYRRNIIKLERVQ